MSKKQQSIDDLLTMYREGTAGMAQQEPRKANKCFNKAHACYKVLKESEEGRQGIIALMNDENPHVRCGAAAHSLFWVPDRARPVLEDLRDAHKECSFDAKMILEEFDGERLHFNY